MKGPRNSKGGLTRLKQHKQGEEEEMSSQRPDRLGLLDYSGFHYDGVRKALKRFEQRSNPADLRFIRTLVSELRTDCRGTRIKIRRSVRRLLQQPGER